MSVLGSWNSYSSQLISVALVTMSLSQKHCKKYVATLFAPSGILQFWGRGINWLFWTVTRFIGLITQNRSFYLGIYGVFTVMLIIIKACKWMKKYHYKRDLCLQWNSMGALWFPQWRCNYFHIQVISSSCSLLFYNFAPLAICLYLKNNYAWVLHTRCF